MRRVDSIDVARGLAALAVAFYHQGFAEALLRTTHWAPFAWIEWPGAALAVPVFFVLSGFCIHAGGMARPGGSVLRFYLQRLIRIYPAWFVAVLLSALVLRLGGQTPTPRELLTHLTLTNGFFNDYRLNVTLWSVSVECCLYLLYPFWHRFRLRHGLPLAALLAAVVSAASCLCAARLFPVPTGASLWFFLNVWCGWIAGAVLAEIWFGPRRALLLHPGWWIGGLAIGVGHAGLLLRDAYSGAGSYLGLPLLIVLCVWPVSLLLVLGERIERQPPAAWLGWLWRKLAALGVISYSLYLLHIPVQALRFILFPDSVASLAGKALLLTGWFGLVLGVAWLAYRGVEEPALRIGRQWLQRWWPEPARSP